jgi:group I intron endonuclease
MQVYLISNLANGKYYVGKTVNPNLHRYLSISKFWAATHEKGKKYFHCMPIIAALRKYGVENFAVDVLTHAVTDEELNMFERLWIVALDCRNPEIGYNLGTGGSGNARRPCSEAAKRKISLANKGKYGNRNGYKMTDAERQSVRDRMKGNKRGKGRGRGHFVSDAEREKHRQNALAQWKRRKEDA